MREFATPLAERQRIAAYYRERYRRDPEYRLRKVNYFRTAKGLPPHGSVEAILPPADVKAVLRDLARSQKRLPNGRFA